MPLIILPYLLKNVGISPSLIIKLLSVLINSLSLHYLLLKLPLAVITIMNSVHNSFIIILKKYKSMGKIYICAAVIFLCTAYPLVLTFGSTGIIISMTLVEGSVLLGSIMATRKKWLAEQR